MAIYRKWFFVLYLASIGMACEPAQGESDMTNFFDGLGATDLGTSKLILPGPIGERGQWIKMIDISRKDDLATSLNVSFRTEYDSNVSPPASGNPVVGYLLWGVGGSRSEVEFDIPPNKTPADLAPSGRGNNAPMANVGGGLQVNISASHVSVYVRHDGNLASIVHTEKSWAAVPPGPPVQVIGDPNAARVLTFVSPGTGPMSPLQRTIHVVGGTTFPPGVTNLLNPAEGVVITVPPFAKRVRFQRGEPDLESLRVVCMTSANPVLRSFSVPVGFEDWIALDPTTTRLTITNSSAAIIGSLQAVFDVTPI